MKYPTSMTAEGTDLRNLVRWFRVFRLDISLQLQSHRVVKLVNRVRKIVLEQCIIQIAAMQISLSSVIVALLCTMSRHSTVFASYSQLEFCVMVLATNLL